MLVDRLFVYKELIGDDREDWQLVAAIPILECKHEYDGDAHFMRLDGEEL